MRNRFARLFICDPCLTLRVAIVLLLLVAIGIQLDKLKALEQKYSLVLKEQALVSRIKEMEGSLKTSQVNPVKRSGKSAFSFEGYLVEGGNYYAIINSSIYRVGDSIRDYRVHEINQDNVVLKHVQTGESETLRLNVPNKS